MYDSRLDRLAGCFVRKPAPWCARRAARWSGSTTRSATPADAATPGSGASARCCAGSATTSGSSRWSSTAAPSSIPLTLLVSLLLGESIMGGSIFSMLGPGSRSLFLFGASGRDPGLRLRPLVDGAERRVAARRRAAHPLQHDVGPPARPGGRGPLRRGADGHHLHHRRRSAVSSSARSRGPYIPPLPFLRGAQFTIGASAPIFGLLGALVYYGAAAAAAWCDRRR